MAADLDAIAQYVVSALGLHMLLKLAFFLLPYRLRRRALDRSYNGQDSATSRTDAVLLAIALALTVFMFKRGLEPSSFLGGFWIGGTLTQLFFHRFHVPLAGGSLPHGSSSPIKLMSYAIQERPSRAWREMASMAVIAVAILIQLWK
jgi:hypothetical protein